jgi:peptidoglycan/LPS O-acetylase OafA/YrhL
LNERLHNNYDFLRLFAAICVSFTHSFNQPGTRYIEPLYYCTAGRITFSELGLLIFFSISGYLIAKSAISSTSLKNYFWKRLLRIQPLLIVVCVLTVFFVGPFFTTLTLQGYFSNFSTWSYFRNIFPLTGIQFTLPGVFSDYQGERGVNGSLWTLIVEERLYLLLGVIVFLPKFGKSLLYLVVGLFNIGYLVNIIFHQNLLPYVSTIAGFYTILFLNASVIFLLGFNFSKKITVYTIISLLLFLLSLVYPFFVFLQLYSVPVLVISIAQIKCFTNKAGKYGDFTYGIYLFSFPIQQMLRSISFFKENPYKLFFITLIIVIPMAILSWYLLERKVQNVKNVVK